MPYIMKQQEKGVGQLKKKQKKKKKKSEWVSP